eukprot:1115101-Prymnesium_polylepis.1
MMMRWLQMPVFLMPAINCTCDADRTCQELFPTHEHANAPSTGPPQACSMANLQSLKRFDQHDPRPHDYATYPGCLGFWRRRCALRL